jgi:dipeptidyl aminopeptidase/acylaminoacyl peptidase
VVYPGEGHGVRKLPAAIDLVARSAAWFERFMPARKDT